LVLTGVFEELTGVLEPQTLTGFSKPQALTGFSKPQALTRAFGI